MKRKQVILVFITVFICLFLFSLPTVSSSALSAEPLATSVAQPELQDQVKLAILEAIASNDRYIQKNLVTSLKVTDIQLSKDQQWATAWMVYYDPEIEALIPTEPSMPVSHFLGDRWQVYLPSDPGWQDALSKTPDDLLAADQKDMWVQLNQTPEVSLTTQSGYFLPWHGGQTAYLSRSVGHDMSFPSGTSHFAFDFFLPGSTQCTSGGQTAGITGLNFDLYSARAGTVWGWKDSVADCDHSEVNFIVLQNADDPTLFQLYMHLAQNSIPQALKSVGAPVARGQFIARADNTGNSTGTHLHFQIEHQPYWPSANPYWNTALDMTFDDVDINGGRPRSSYYDPAYCDPSDVCDVFRSTYVSGNYYMGDSTPPTGGLGGVENGAVVNAQTLTLSGWGWDAQTGLDYGQLIALFDGSWHNLGPQFNPTITYNWDLCDPQLPVPYGQVSVALRLYDIAGNPAPQVGLRTFTQSYTCPVPPPSCVPGPDQVSLFEDAYYKGGCVKYNAGNYPNAGSLGSLGNDDAESILVGANVAATLYSEENYAGHSQAFSASTGYLKYQWLPADVLSSMKVASRTTPPQAPVPINPVASSVFRAGDVIPFSWQNGGNDSEYHIELYLNSNLYQSLPWQADPVRYVDSLPMGSYSWRVQGRNSGSASAWSGLVSFSIESPIVIPSAKSIPYSDDMESTQSQWISSMGSLWRYVDNSAMAHSGTRSWWYQNSLGDYETDGPNSGSLTSPPISISSAGYYLRFYYRYQTETQGTTWDQRWVQVSVDGGPFTNLTQLRDDPLMPETSSWMQNKALDLSTYAGHTIRVRFQFTTLDARANNFSGWGIDDFSITSTPPTTCGDNRQDESPNQAFFLTYDPSITIPGEVCPNGDYDFYKFSGSAGDRIVADIDAMIDGSPLDSYLFLIDTDGQTVLAENDDEVYSVRRDPLLSYTLSKSGIYYLKLKAWKHPLVGGQNNFYTIRLYEDHTKPQAVISWPPSSSYLPDTVMDITAQVNEVTNGVNRVEFYWHSTDWLTGNWIKLGTDYDGTDGWSVEFNPSGQPEGTGAAIYIDVYDMAGNWSGATTWNLGIDKTPPVTAMQSLTGTPLSNAVLLGWTGIDNLSGIDYFEIQESMNGGAWTTQPRVDGSIFNYWYIGNPGNTYSFRMHGVDHSGNSENYPASAETSTSIPAAAILCNSLDTYDSAGNDNSPENASLIYLDGGGQFHNFCNPLIAGFQNDEDWVKLIPIPGQNYFIINQVKSQASATVISLFAQDGTTLLAESQPMSFGYNTVLDWIADRDEPVYLRLRHADGRVIGTNVGGTLFVKTGYSLLFPFLQHH